MRLIRPLALALSCLVASVNAQTPIGSGAANGPASNEIGTMIRPISLEECIELALAQNLDLQIARYGPRTARFSLSSAYGAYDPVLEMRANQNQRDDPERFDPSSGFSISRSSSTEDDFRTGLTGLLPTGLNYNMFANIGHTRGLTENLLSGFDEKTDQYVTRVGVTMSQPLLRNAWIDSDRLQIQVSRKDLERSEYDLTWQVMTLVRQVEGAYYNLISALDLVKSSEKALERSVRLFEENRKKVEVGVLPPLDEKQAASEVATAQASLIEARRQVSAEENVVKGFITDNYEQWHGLTLMPTDEMVALPESYDLGESWYSAITRRPDYQSVQKALEVTGLRVSYAKNQLFPTMNIEGSYGRLGVDNFGSFGQTVRQIEAERSPSYSFGVVLRFPLTLRRERNQYKLAQAQQEQDALELKRRHQGILVEVDEAVKQAKATFERVGATKEARLFAEAAVDAEQKKLENGKSTSFQVLTLQRNLTDAQAAEIRALAAYFQALIDLYYREGTILQRRRIVLDFN